MVAFKGDIYYYCVDYDLIDEVYNIDIIECEVYLFMGFYDYVMFLVVGWVLVDDIKGVMFVEMEGLGYFLMSEDFERFFGYVCLVFDGICIWLG